MCPEHQFPWAPDSRVELTVQSFYSLYSFLKAAAIYPLAYPALKTVPGTPQVLNMGLLKNAPF